MPKSLSHYDRSGKARMVDVSSKSATRREASASGFVAMQPKVLKALAWAKMKMAAVFAIAIVGVATAIGASVAALTIYDMCKALDKGIEIREIVLERKTGGKSGDYVRPRRKP